jgi:hypothetical protein
VSPTPPSSHLLTLTNAFKSQLRRALQSGLIRGRLVRDKHLHAALFSHSNALSSSTPRFLSFSRPPNPWVTTSLFIYIMPFQRNMPLRNFFPHLPHKYLPLLHSALFSFMRFSTYYHYPSTTSFQYIIYIAFLSFVLHLSTRSLMPYYKCHQVLTDNRTLNIFESKCFNSKSIIIQSYYWSSIFKTGIKLFPFLCKINTHYLFAINYSLIVLYCSIP